MIPPVTYHDVEQRSEAWHALRVGKLTASRSGDAQSFYSQKPLKSGKPSKAKPQETAARRNLRAQLVLEILTKKSHERGFTSQAIRDGIDREPDAVAAFELLTGRLVHPIGFVSHDRVFAGCSPDGFIGDDGLISIKSPIPATHLDFIRTQKIPHDYYMQILHESWLTGRRWCEFLSYQPDFAAIGLDAVLKRVTLTDAQVAEYEVKALAFLNEVDLEVLALRTMADTAATLRAAAAVA